MSSPNLAIPHLAASQSQKTVTVNAAIDDLDNALNALTSIAISDANQTFTQAQMASGCVFVITGTLTADRTIVVPSIPRLFAMKNSTSGGHNLVVKTSAGTGITFLSTAGYVILYCDGTNVQELSAASTGGTVDIGGDIGGTSSSPEVIGIEAVPISAAPTVVGEALVYNGTDWVPSPWRQSSSRSIRRGTPRRTTPRPATPSRRAARMSARISPSTSVRDPEPSR